MTVVDIPFNNTQVVKVTGYSTRVQSEVRDWIWETFGNCQYSADPYAHLDFIRFTFLKAEHALLFKLRWGGQ